MMLTIVPCTLEQANTFVRQFHRHNKPVVGARLTFAVADETGDVHGVVIVGRPVARMLDDGWTLEINRVCTDGYPNASSFLMAAAWRAAQAIGYRRLVTYTLPEEGGASLRAVGWKSILRKIGHQWSCVSRPREEAAIYLLDKYRWEVEVSGKLSFEVVQFPQEQAPALPTLFEEVL